MRRRGAINASVLANEVLSAAKWEDFMPMPWYLLLELCGVSYENQKESPSRICNLCNGGVLLGEGLDPLVLMQLKRLFDSSTSKGPYDSIPLALPDYI